MLETLNLTIPHSTVEHGDVVLVCHRHIVVTTVRQQLVECTVLPFHRGPMVFPIGDNHSGTKRNHARHRYLHLDT